MVSFLCFRKEAASWAGVKVHPPAGKSPPLLFMKGVEIFIDESGDFGPYDSRCPDYTVTMVGFVVGFVGDRPYGGSGGLCPEGPATFRQKV